MHNSILLLGISSRVCVIRRSFSRVSGYAHTRDVWHAFTKNNHMCGKPQTDSTLLGAYPFNEVYAAQNGPTVIFFFVSFGFCFCTALFGLLDGALPWLSFF